MPAIALKNVAAGTSNALDGLKFQELLDGALISIWATTAVAGGNIDFSVGNEDHLVGAELNIEESADTVDTDRDAVLLREPVAPGKMFLAVNAQICNFVLLIEEP